MRLPEFSAEASLTRAPARGRSSDGNGERLSGVHPAQLPCLYGNWCGPGCSGPDAPVDDVDECCRIHDGCYGDRGYFACSCDQELLGCVGPKMDAWTEKGLAAAAIWTYFSQSWCNPFA